MTPLITSISSVVPTDWRAMSQSSPSTPELGRTKLLEGKPEEAVQTPTLCINCQTTNTPLWRRDQEGQPLCEIMRTYLQWHLLDGCFFSPQVMHVVCSL